MTINSIITPHPLIQPNGQPLFAQFDTPVSNLAINQFDYRTVMDKRASAWAKYVHFKQFQFVSISHPQWQIGIALADIRYVGNAFCYFYDRQTNTLDEISLLKPPATGYQLSQSPVSGHSWVKGKQQIDVYFNGYNWQVKLNGTLLQGDIELQGLTSSQPLALCTPTGYNGWTYTQKHNALTLSGQLHYRGQSLDLTKALAGYDFSAGYMRRETSWRWGSISAMLPQGRFGLNIAAGVNETGATENLYWLDEQRVLLPPVQITLDRQQPGSPWQFHSNNGQLQLQFTPHACRRERLNLGFLASNFRQYCGFFSGTIQTADGGKLNLDQVPGLAEDHFARW